MKGWRRGRWLDTTCSKDHPTVVCVSGFYPWETEAVSMEKVNDDIYCRVTRQKLRSKQVSRLYSHALTGRSSYSLYCSVHIQKQKETSSVRVHEIIKMPLMSSDNVWSSAPQPWRSWSEKNLHPGSAIDVWQDSALVLVLPRILKCWNINNLDCFIKLSKKPSTN